MLVRIHTYIHIYMLSTVLECSLCPYMFSFACVAREGTVGGCHARRPALQLPHRVAAGVLPPDRGRAGPGSASHKVEEREAVTVAICRTYGSASCGE